MKINSLYISAFGGLKNKKIDFSDGFNLIYGNNEDGKTTLMAFIKMMFYGSERAAGSIAKNIRKKYTPWDGSPMAGSIDFEHSGKKYRIEKEFRSSNSTDKTTLVDLSLGNRQSVPSDIGTKFFGLTAAAFERSVFIGQFGFPEKDSAAQSELNSKLSNLSLTGDEDVSYEEIFAKLQKAKLSLMSKSGKAGEYDKNLAALNEAKLELESALENQKALNLFKNEGGNLVKQIGELEKQIAVLRDKLALKEDAQNAEKLEELLKTKSDLDALNHALTLKDGSVVDEMFLRKLQFCLSKFTAAENKAQEKENQIKLLKQSLEAGSLVADATPETKVQLENEIEKLETANHENKQKITGLEAAINTLNISAEKQKGMKNKGVFSLISGLVLIVLAAVLGFLSLPLPAAISGTVGLVVSALGIVLMSSSSKYAKFLLEIEETRQKLSALKMVDLEKEIFQKKVKLEAVTAALNSNTSVIEKQKEQLKSAELELAELNISSQKELDVLTQTYTLFKPFVSMEDFENSLEEISKICEKQKELKNSLNFLLKDLKNISYEEAATKLATLKEKPLEKSADYEGMKNELDSLIDALSDKKQTLATISAEMKATQKTAKNPESIRAKIKDLTEKTDSQKEFCSLCDIAMEVLSDSYGELRSGFGSLLEEKSTAIFENLSNGKYGSMTVSDSFDIGVTEKGVFGNREIDYLSSGAADQAYLSLRLAISSLMSGEEPLPILLDDSLAQYDDNRVDSTIKFLKEFSNTTQTVMFTCHSHIKTLAEESDAHSISVK